MWLASGLTLASLLVVGVEERMLAKIVLKVGKEVPEGSCLVVVLHGRHVDSSSNGRNVIKV